MNEFTVIKFIRSEEHKQECHLCAQCSQIKQVEQIYVTTKTISTQIVAEKCKICS